MRIVCLSDTHMQLNAVAEKFGSILYGDILLHSGDFSYRGTLTEMSSQFYALGQIGKKFKHTVACLGNHDWLGEKDPAAMRVIADENGVRWLQDSMTIVDGISVYGSAYTPEFCGWAYNLDRHDGSLEEAWDKIPDGIDILLTHGPSWGNLDHSYDGPLGCIALKAAIERVKPRLHVFGHIHHAYGAKIGADGVAYLNASCCDESYSPINKPISLNFDTATKTVEIIND